MVYEVDVGEGARLAVFGLGEDDQVDNVDVALTDRDGLRWTATVLTIEELAAILSRHAASGESMGGSFLRIPDLIILREPTLVLLVKVMMELVRTGEYRNELTLLPPEPSATGLDE